MRIFQLWFPIARGQETLRNRKPALISRSSWQRSNLIPARIKIPDFQFRFRNYQSPGLMFWFTLKKLWGSYRFFI